MRIKLLIATSDSDYAGRLSEILLADHADVIDVSVCSTDERLAALLSAQRFDVALLDTEYAECSDLSNIHLPLLLWTGEDNTGGIDLEIKKVKKYQRISLIVADVLEHFARATSNRHNSDLKRARVTAVWSPAGGVGKTSVSLAYAAKKVSEGRKTLYLNLEPFSSGPVYFPESGKSVSTVFEMLEAQEGNVKMLVQGISCKDSGVSYLCRPENFDDMNILSAENITVLIDACSELTDELIIDMSSVCGERERQVFELADKVFLVTDNTSTAQIKLSQFTSQHNVFERIRAKSTLVKNRGAAADIPLVDASVTLPLVQSVNAVTVYKTLSGYGL